MPTPERERKVRRVLASKQPDLRVVLDGVTIAHNASAVIRTCDAAGILYLDLISPNPELLDFNKAISTGAHKWLEIGIHSSAANCLSPLKKEGFKIVGTHLQGNSVPYTEFDYNQPVVLVFGSEAEGLTGEALEHVDVNIRIPMLGMVRSLNLSVSAAVVLFEALRQRIQVGRPNSRTLSKTEFDRLLAKWLDSSDSDETDPSSFLKLSS
jgi:tRNA (guanosine-2'-O-)-methyltransferase